MAVLEKSSQLSGDNPILTPPEIEGIDTQKWPFFSFKGRLGLFQGPSFWGPPSLCTTSTSPSFHHTRVPTTYICHRPHPHRGIPRVSHLKVWGWVLTGQGVVLGNGVTFVSRYLEIIPGLVSGYWVAG